MFLCCARTIMAMTVALLLASGSTTEGLAVQAIKTSVSESSQFQLSASKDGDALFRPPPSNTGTVYHTVSVSRKRKAGVDWNPTCYAQGLVKSGDWGLVTTLPSECCPNKRLVFNLNHHETTARVDVFTNGQVVWQAGGKTFGWISLTGIMFVPSSGNQSSGNQQPLALENGWKDYGRGYGPPTVALGDTCSVQGLVESAGWGSATTSGCQSKTKGTLVTSKGEGKVGTCTFPFTYSGTTYDSCASPDDYGGVGWCAWDTTYASERWGYCTPGCPGTDVIATLPSECRPNKRLVFALNQHETTARVDVFTNGQVVWVAGSKTRGWVSLTGITFVPGADNDQQPLALENGWKDYGRGYGPPTVALGDTCSVQGLVESAGDWGLIATLPAECRPNKQLIFNLNQHTSPARVDVLTNGEVVWVAGSKAVDWLSLAGITFVPGADNQQPLALENGWKAYGKNWGSPILILAATTDHVAPTTATTQSDDRCIACTLATVNLTANATDDGQQSKGIPGWGYALIGIGALICCCCCSVLLISDDSDDGTSTDHGPAIVQPVVREVSEEHFDGFGSDGGELGGESDDDAKKAKKLRLKKMARTSALANLSGESEENFGAPGDDSDTDCGCCDSDADCGGGPIFLSLLVVGLLAGTLAVFIDAGSNKGSQSVKASVLLPDNVPQNDPFINSTNITAMRCFDPRPDPITNSTAHYGDCCDEYGVTPKPLWVLLLQALVTALVFDLSGHIFTGKATGFTFESMSTLAICFAAVQGILAMVSTYSILTNFDYTDSRWDNYTGLCFIWGCSSAGPTFASIGILVMRDMFSDSDHDSSSCGEAVFMAPFALTVLGLPQMVTHVLPGIFVFFPMAFTSLIFALWVGPYALIKTPLIPEEGEQHTVGQRLIYVPARALISSWMFCCGMIMYVISPSWMNIFYTNPSWAGARAQDWEARNTGRFFECLNTQFQSVAGRVDAVSLIF